MDTSLFRVKNIETLQIFHASQTGYNDMFKIIIS